MGETTGHATGHTSFLGPSFGRFVVRFSFLGVLFLVPGLLFLGVLFLALVLGVLVPGVSRS